MTRTSRIARTAAGLLILGAAVACTFNITFDQDKSITVDANGTALSQVQAIDLSTQPDVQAHKANVKSLDLNQAILTITAVDALNTWATVTGSVALRPDGLTDSSQDVAVGSLTNFAITQGNTVTLQGSTALDAFVLNAVKGTGKFQIVITGSTTGGQVGKFTIDAKLKLAMEYET
ncbi:MAG: hypothetical protein JST92_03285 [Deltaproteobacteria bacterium]|nr:hypothetical protein [Deltaproteobacteria bacterium]